MTIVSLLSDFGEKDGFTGIMKGVIWSIAPQVQIADLTHEIEPQNICQGAIVLSNAFPYFPNGSIHIAVVDPGVGTGRRAIAIHTADQFFIGPDNGIFSLVLQQAEDRGFTLESVELDRPAFWLPNVSRSFHGRDIFAPVAAHLANGRKLSELGTPIQDLVRIQVPIPVRTDDGWQGEIIAIDHFGNLITNLTEQHILSRQSARLKVGEMTVTGISQTFGNRAAGDLVAIIDSSNQLSIAVVNGSAANRIKAKVGDAVRLVDTQLAERKTHAS